MRQKINQALVEAGNTKLEHKNVIDNFNKKISELKKNFNIKFLSSSFL